MRPVPELELPACVLARTEDWIAIEKPPGLPSRPAPGHEGHALGQLESWLGPAHRPGVVHRLDRDTSGVLLFSLSARGYRDLRSAFRERTIKKEYVAWVIGAPRPRRGSIDLPLRRNASGGMIVDARGLPALTRYETIKRRGELTLVSLQPATGRMHQLRVHLAARGTPILGDRRYGIETPTTLRRDARARRLWLHARRIRLPENLLPVGQATGWIESPLPLEFERLAEHS